ncbi:PRD domain-containing protein [Isobaculum melis]|uniref:PRD domain-containing protein n=1 Tax=Isobaculum melis TaxID=142588 RepID=A0A1H9UAW2_9LACT|nr:PRD domain-containing protein [Isobaculum melis]SES06401.1 PRD domain-containing protein [Isobaculum melis]
MIQEKLTVLKTANVIDEAVYQYMQEVLSVLETKELVEKSEVFMTHLAMATARQQKGESVGALDALIVEQMKAETQYEEAVAIWHELAALAPVTFHEDELAYLYLHLCTMLAED